MAHVTCMLRTLPIFMKKSFHLCSLYVPRSNNEFVCACMRSQNAFAAEQTAGDLLCARNVADLTRGKAELLAENALLWQQLMILRRQIKRPICKKTDRLFLALLARMARTWKQALFLVQPETLLCWHRELFRLFWIHKSKARSSKPRLSLETISLIKEMVANNRLWGAKRIRGELLKLNIRVSKRTIQKYMRQARPNCARGQTWKTFLRNQAKDV